MFLLKNLSLSLQVPQFVFFIIIKFYLIFFFN